LIKNNAIAYTMLCLEVFMSDTLPKKKADELLMMASWHGGMSIAYSQVGIVHAMSYGLSYVLGTKHGIGNCIVFDQLEKYYPKDVQLFRDMMDRHNISLPKNLCEDLGDDEIETMIEVAFGLEPLWENALGAQWRKKISAKDLYSLYRKM
jgi:3-deoxy-alpha-D-manno-octulosonate 8-oxidase